MTDIRSEVAEALFEAESRPLTWPDGPVPPYEDRVLDALAARGLTVVREGELDVERLQTAMQNVGYTIEDDMNMETRAIIRPLRWFQAPDIAAEYAALTRQPEGQS